MGASAQECSAFSPMVPFLKTIRLKDLSNHLWWRREEVEAWHAQAASHDAPRSAAAIPVVAFAVEEALGVAVQGLDGVLWVVALLRVVQGHEEGWFLNGVQRELVLSAAEVGVASVGPRRPAKQRARTHLENVEGGGSPSNNWHHRCEQFLPIGKAVAGYNR